MYIIEGTMQVIEQNQETIQIIFGIPSFLLLRFLGTTRYLSLSMILWGSVMIGMAFVTNARELLVLRFLLGMIVAAYFPGITIYLSLWYRKAEQTMRISLFFGAAITAGIFGGIISYGIAQIRNLSSLKDWQWIFLLEGIPIILLGVLTYLFLSSIPETVQCKNQQNNKTILLNSFKT
ncbi:unnamed protein product [Rotaria sp. Silwood1]|nr:unnamed protein product [Rotaria sp. Silwood1]CAF1502495.1 unnamed protein product [Rotaria sp. Silwood1]